MSLSRVSENQFLSDHYLSTHLSHLYGRVEPTRRLKKQYHEANILPHVACSKDAQILEIGPGFGELLELLLEKGSTNITALDISSEVIEHLKKCFPQILTVHANDTVKFLRSKQSAFELIVMLDVAEHIPKEHTLELLEACRNSLKPGGRLILQTTNLGCPYGRNIFYADFTHETGFNEVSLFTALKAARFLKIDIYGYRFPKTFVGSIRTILRKPFQALSKIGAILHGALRLKILDPNLIAVAHKETGFS